MNREKNRLLRKIEEKSNEYLKSVSAFDLMKDSAFLQKDIHNAIGRYKLPVSVIAGVLTSEMSIILEEVSETAMAGAIGDVLQGRDKMFKEYLDRNFMKKERP